MKGDPVGPKIEGKKVGVWGRKIFLISFASLLSGCLSQGRDGRSVAQPNEQPEPRLTQKLWGYDFAERHEEGNIRFLEFLSGGEKIELILVNEIEENIAGELVSEKILLFKSIFELRRTGYPGQHTRYIECPDEFKPKYFEKGLDGGHLKYFSGFANSNYVAGACSKNTIRYKMIYGFLYCHQEKMLIELSHFAPLESPERTKAFIGKVNCEFE